MEENLMKVKEELFAPINHLLRSEILEKTDRLMPLMVL